MVNVSQPFIILCPNDGSATQALAPPDFVQAKDEDMRDFREAKAMAHTLRAALAAKGFKISISESLELIAEAFGVADWNTLAATIREARALREDATPPPDPTVKSGGAFSRELEMTLHRALAFANARDHEYATLEHLLLALTDDAVASAVMKACKVDPQALKENLVNYIDNELWRLVIEDGPDAMPTRAFHRVVQRAVLNTQRLGRDMVTGGDFLVAMFAETESPAVRFLSEQGMTGFDAVNFMIRGGMKGGGDPAI
jgi:hypothetical protein